MLKEISDGREELLESLLEIWRHSVTASHNFLSAENIEELEFFVNDGILQVENLVVAYEGYSVLGFMGVTNRKIEFLFVSPENFRQGWGRKFVNFAAEKYSAQFVDCNEQNVDALKFYEHLGFEIFAREEFDGQGNPFPILKLRNKSVSNLLKTEICGMKMTTPILAASGTFGFGEEFADFVDISRLGGVMVKCTTLKPRSGNVGVRIAETPAGMLNCIGLENPGVEKFLSEILPRIKNYDTNIIVNISGGSVEDYGELAKLLDVDGVAAIELNISCPNVKDGGIIFGTDPNAAAAVTEIAKKNTGKPVIVKLSPNVTDITEIAKAVESAGADCLSLINTLMGMQININTWKPTLGNITGGLSGGAIKPVAVRMVWQTAQVVNIPIIGMGGIFSADDAVEFLLAGAAAVAVGTANFATPDATMKIADGLENYLQSRGISNVNEIVGGVDIGN